MKNQEMYHVMYKTNDMDDYVPITYFTSLRCAIDFISDKVNEYVNDGFTVDEHYADAFDVSCKDVKISYYVKSVM